jgi:ectoine hydroxylase-related dioxygenase (phytanoyl-CoA dioxygenase family)
VRCDDGVVVVVRRRRHAPVSEQAHTPHTRRTLTTPDDMASINSGDEPRRRADAATTTTTTTTRVDPSRVDADADKVDFKEWARLLYEHGFLVIENAVPDAQVRALRADLHDANRRDAGAGGHSKSRRRNRTRVGNARHTVHKAFFERSRTTVDVIESSVLTRFAQHVIADVPNARPGGTSLDAHVFHNNAFSVPATTGRGQAPGWHTDDPVHNVILPTGTRLPSGARLPVLACTYMLWLSDVTTPEHGPTHVIPGSHNWCRGVDTDEALAHEARGHVALATGRAGTAVLVNSQVWHRGAGNTSGTDRDTLQLSYGRRLVGHKFKSVMNYEMPRHVYAGRSDATRTLLGFVQGGAYS